MNEVKLPVNPLDQPACINLWEQFMEHLVRRESDTCVQLLDKQQCNGTETYQRHFIDYCRAILFLENNQWDRGERLLIPLLQRKLHPAFQMRILNVRAVANEHLGRLAEAMELYEATMMHADQQGDKVFWAKATKNRAICAIRSYEMGQMAKEPFLSIRTDLEQTIQIFQTIGDRLEEGRCWNELGAFHKALGQWTDAIPCYEQDLAICREQHHQHGIAASLNNIGEALIHRTHYARAESMLREAVNLFATLEDPYEQADALVNLGNALAYQGKQEEAVTIFEQAIVCVESVRRGIDAQSARNDFFATQAHIYGAKIAHCLQQGDIENAFNYTERARARGLLEMVAGADLRIPTAIPNAVSEREQALRQQLAQAGEDDGTVRATIELELEQFYRELQLTAPEYVSFREVHPLPAAEIAKALPSNTAILSYFVLGNRCIAFVLSRCGITSHELPLAMTDLLATAFDGQGRPRSILATQGNHLPRPWLLERLYATLVQPLAEHYHGFHRLVIIPHGPLHHLPLHAAYNQADGRYLCEMFDIVYAPSATIQIAYLRHKRRDSKRSGVLSILCDADGLIHPHQEVQSIAHQSKGTALVDSNATLARLLELAGNYQYLHFAGHAWFRKDRPMLSGIALIERRLTAWDILQLPDLGFSLVTVNGCDSGLSRVQPGDELLGLLRALLYSVAPSVLLTIWPIDDLAARIFMQIFYRILITETNADQPFSHVLRKTIQTFRQVTCGEVISMLNEDGYSTAEAQEMLARLPRQSPRHGSTANDEYPFEHPYFWAGYLLIGEPWIAVNVKE